MQSFFSNLYWCLCIGSFILLSACSLSETEEPSLKTLNASIKIIEPEAIINSTLTLHEIEGFLFIDGDAQKTKTFNFRDRKLPAIPLVLTEGSHTFRVEFDIQDAQYGHVKLLTSEPSSFSLTVGSENNLLFADNYAQPDADGDQVSNIEELDFSFSPYDSSQFPPLAPIRVPHAAIRFSNPVDQGMTISWEPAKHKLTGVNIKYRLIYSLVDNISTTLPATINGIVYGEWITETTSIVRDQRLAHSSYWNVVVEDTELNNNVFASALPNGMGILDTSFSRSADGFLNREVTLAKPFGSQAADIATDSLDKFIVVGREFTSTTTSTMAVWSYEQNGNEHSTFGNGLGMVALPNPNGVSSDDTATAMALDENGNIYVTGHIGSSNSNTGHDMVLWKLFRNGAVDKTGFGNSQGYVISNSIKGPDANLSESGNAITIDNKGNILVAGSADTLNTKTVIVVWRYTNTGLLDLDFGNGKGYITHNGLGGSTGNPRSNAYAIAVDSFGNIYVSGYTTNANGDTDLALWKFNDSGSSISSFGENSGFTVHHNAAGGNINDAGHALHIDNINRKIVVSGVSQSGANTQAMAVWRFLDGGQLDTSFANSRGYLSYNVPSGNATNDRGNSIVMDSHDNIIVAGSYSKGSDIDMAIWRFTPAGILDTSFGPGTGYVTHNDATLSNSQSNDIGNTISINSKGKYLISGESQDLNGVSNMTVWQYQ